MIEDGAAPEPRTRATQTHTLVKALKGVPTFGACDDPTLLQIVGDSVNLVWPAGVRVFENETPSSELFGELSLLLGTSHRHTVETLEHSELMVLPKKRFDALLDEHPELAKEIRRKAEERMAMNR